MSKDERRYEVRIVRTEARPTCVRLGRFRPWRWNVTAYDPIEGIYPGVYDRRLHQGTVGHGWAVTRLGASVAAGRATPSLPAPPVPGSSDRTEGE